MLPRPPEPPSVGHRNTLTVQYSYLLPPRWLRESRLWVLMRLEPVPGKPKPAKVPYSPNDGRRASCTDPTTWATFDACMEAFNRGGYDGVAFALVGDGLVFIDWDRCVSDFASVVDLAVLRWVAYFGSYTELSISETGLHTLVRGRLERAIKSPLIELYATKRFVCWTGMHLVSAPSFFEERQEQLDALVAALQPEPATRPAAPVWSGIAPDAITLDARLARARLSWRTRSLLESTGPDSHGSASEADAALCTALAGAGFSAEEVLSIFSNSPRGADAIRRKQHGGRDHGDYYIRRTVEHACSHVGPVLERDGLRVRLAGSGASLRVERRR
jgi:primase-polymerase (primpol)-like protein